MSQAGKDVQVRFGLRRSKLYATRERAKQHSVPLLVLQKNEIRNGQRDAVLAVGAALRSSFIDHRLARA
jgi:hypothetical protein